jgi:hypothetical protein
LGMKGKQRFQVIAFSYINYFCEKFLNAM